MPLCKVSGVCRPRRLRHFHHHRHNRLQCSLMAAPRKCSHCGCNGHNARTCAERVSVKLFGVCISSASYNCGSMRKSASTGNLADTTSSSPCTAATRQDGYASEDLPHTSRPRKKGVPWSEEEHKLFLLALHKLGKGDWRGISKHFVKTRTPTQVASHAQKHFMRQSNLSKRRRRSSLFDMNPDVVTVDAVPETLQESDSKSIELEAVKDINARREMPLADDADMSFTSMLQVGSDTNHDILDVPSNDRQPLYTSAYRQFAGWKASHYPDPTLFFYYTTWPRTQGFPSFVQLPNSESKIVRPIPLTPRSKGEVNVKLEPLKPNNGVVCPVKEHTFLCPALLRDKDKPRQSAFHTLTIGDNQEVSNQSHLCNVISVA